MDSAKTNRRLGIKVPRSTLLPPYLLINDYFVEYTNAIDAVFGPDVDDKIAVIASLRNMWVQNPTTEESVIDHTIITKDEWSAPERSIVVKQVNMLGMKVQNAGVISDDAYQTISRFVGMYWFGKGTGAFVDFINYCLSSDLRVKNMWTEDYIDFYAEGDGTIGTPIWEGGTWYPTTHVTIEANGGLQDLDIFTLQSFFYEIANYNLVLQAIEQSFDMPIVSSKDSEVADIVALGMVATNSFVIANFKNTGTTPPPMYEMPDEQLPSTYHAMGGVTADFNTAFLLAQPSGWMLIEGVGKVPVYGAPPRVVRNEADIGVKLLGDPLPGGVFNLLYGPVTWIPIPGSTRSQTRLPSYGTASFTIKDGVSVSAKSVGVTRTMLLVNPTGFFELQPGQFVPYW